MNDEIVEMVRDLAARLLNDVASPDRTATSQAAGIDAALWEKFAEAGLRGAGGDLALAGQLAVLEEIGYAAALIPFAESEVLAHWLLEGTGLAFGRETLSIIVVPRDSLTKGPSLALRLKGQRVSWGRNADHILALCEDGDASWVVALAPSSLQLRHEVNLAGEPADIIEVDQISLRPADLRRAAPGRSIVAIRQRGALCRAAAMLGAMARTLELTVQYSRDRVQFGRSLSQFQVIQSYLAEIAAEISAASASLDLALAGAQQDEWSGDVAVAKIRVGQAVKTVTRLSHQIHGAIGMTREYPLHLWTRRLWAWREEWGAESWWADELGTVLITAGDQAFWPSVTAGLSMSYDNQWKSPHG